MQKTLKKKTYKQHKLTKKFVVKILIHVSQGKTAFLNISLHLISFCLFESVRNVTDHRRGI
jgi:hypothetical protein